MGLFTPRDTNALAVALDRGSLDDFLDVYRPRWVDDEDAGGSTLLSKALNNSDLDHGRVLIAHRLLDDGADVTRGHPVHVLLGGHHHDWEREPGLLSRMLDLGADVNGRYLPGDGSTPLEVIGSQFHRTDEQFAGFYDVLLARPDLDLRQTSPMSNRTIIEILRQWVEYRPDLVRRAEAVLARGSG